MVTTPRKSHKRGKARPDRQLSKLQREILAWVSAHSKMPPTTNETLFEEWSNSASWSSKAFNRNRENQVRGSVLSESIKALEARGLLVAIKGVLGLGGIRTNRLRLLILDQSASKVKAKTKVVDLEDDFLMPVLPIPNYPFYFVNDIAIFLKKHPETIRRYIRAGKLKAVKKSKMHEIQATDLKAFIKSRQQFVVAKDTCSELLSIVLFDIGSLKVFEGI